MDVGREDMCGAGVPSPNLESLLMNVPTAGNELKVDSWA